ncbi:uncharacterized transcriptional regulatory protein TBS1-like isoform X1 [Coffea eugenioides]|uniref:uncharacterized transcriptional regulatory protein TBS1-like isoform X1 n=1 Tax=Coffea eugenioides TaxID=49369 RepID=UPI000F6152D8|nr:uncharacterized transcriptional regulatory protein TBS1-like isoform X1 [Coffea eugenioides]
MKKCELCNSTAKMYCDSDQASLCWDCDARVHTANFLVAKHLRTLLCHACQSPTPWTASGPKLGPTVSVCQACANRTSSSIDGDHDPENNRDDNDEDDDEDDADSEDEDDQDDNDDGDSSDDSGDEDDGDNQVVPLSSTPLPPPLISSSSSSEDSLRRSSRRRDGGVSSSRIGYFSNHSNENGRFSCDQNFVLQRIERSRQKGNYRISSPTSWV